jgi:hypothetical protein
MIADYRELWGAVVAASIAFGIWNPNIEGLPAIIGAAVGMILFSALAAALVALVCRVFRRPLGRRSKVAVFCCIWVAFMVLSVVGVVGTRPRAAIGVTAEVFLYSPRGAEFLVEFPAKPDIRKSAVQIYTGAVADGETAELLVPGGFLLRAENMPFPRNTLVAIGREEAINSMQQYAYFNGIKKPEFRFEHAAAGRRAKMRGIKILRDDEGNEYPVTMEMQVSYGDTMVLMLYTAGPSNSYPVPAVVRFLESVQRR